MGYKPGAHCRLDYIREDDWERLAPELRGRVRQVLDKDVVGRRLVDVVKELRARGEMELARDLVQCVRLG